MAVNFAEIRLAKETIPQYEGGSKNLSYFLMQCEKFIRAYKSPIDVCPLNNLLFETCCSQLTGVARDILVTSDCSTWAKLKKALLDRFGDQRNETLLATDLNTCYQLINETYDSYYERIKNKLQILLEHVTIREQDEGLKQYKISLHKASALDTFKAGLLEPYRTHLSNQTVESIEDCMLQLRNYDNHKKQVEFLNFMRNKAPEKHHNNVHRNANQRSFSHTPRFTASTPQSNNQFSNFRPFHQNRFNNSYHQNNNNNYNQNGFPRGPVNYQTRPVQNRYFTNSQVFGRKPEPKPTPMSISTRNTFNPSRNQPNNHFQKSGPSNFTSEELYNMEEPDQTQFENQEFVENMDEPAGNFTIPASEQPTST